MCRNNGRTKRFPENDYEMLDLESSVEGTVWLCAILVYGKSVMAEAAQPPPLYKAMMHGKFLLGFSSLEHECKQGDGRHSLGRRGLEGVAARLPAGKF